MSDYLLGEGANLYDPVTGAWMGIVDRRGKEQPVFSADGTAVLNPLTGAGGPLTTALSSPNASGYTMAGTLDERRESANLIALNTLDTQYDNMTSPATFASGVDVAMGSNAIRNLAWLL